MAAARAAAAAADDDDDDGDDDDDDDADADAAQQQCSFARVRSFIHFTSLGRCLLECSGQIQLDLAVCHVRVDLVAVRRDLLRHQQRLEPRRLRRGLAVEGGVVALRLATREK
jgi:hypothetical protein